MSLITQCPACSTMFRVVPDQLRISGGWVRCGHCDEVFDANAHLRSLEQPAAVLPDQQTEPEPLPAFDVAAPAIESVSHEDPQWIPDPVLDPVEQSDPYDWSPLISQPDAMVEAYVPSDAAAVVADDAPAYSMDADPFLDQSPHGLEQEALPVQDGLAPLEDWAAFQEPKIPPAVEPETVDEVILPDAAPLSFMPPAEGKPAGRGMKAMAGVCALLALLLAVQLLVSERDRVAATAPALRPLLTKLCGMLACTIGPPRQIESIAIDSSAFTTVKPGVYLLHVTLKNTAAMDLAAPALELTLTDTQDQPLLRRVIPSAEFSGQRPISAGGELAASLPISVPLASVPEKIAGYKLLAFYP